MDTSSPIAACRNERGFAMVYVAILLMMLFGFLGLAVDGAHLFKVRHELQNAADAAALQGAYHLYTRVPDQTPTLQWPEALRRAQDLHNKSDGEALEDAVVSVGYWNLAWNGSDAHDLQSPDPSIFAPTSDDIPAVKVVVKRGADNNGGAVSNFFMQIFGVDTVAVSSKPAVAMVGFPGAVPPNNLFPMAISKCVTDYYFSHSISDPPPQININSPYGAGGAQCDSGQWTSFKLDSNSVPDVRELISNGNPDSLSTGDSIWIQPGTEATLYDASKWNPALPEDGKDVVMAVVDDLETNLRTHGKREVTGFVTFHIDGVVKAGSASYVYGHFIDFITAPPGIRPGGATSNTVTLPIMAQ